MGEPLDRQPDRLTYEGGSWGMYAAPGCVVFIEAWHNGRKQTIGIDPGPDADEFVKAFHKAKRHARKPMGVPSGEGTRPR